MELPDYLDHFRLNRAPFGAAPDAALFYGQGARAELLGALAYAVTHGDGIVKITGDAGSGMTMLCHALAAQLAGQAVIIHMEPGSLGPLGVIHAVALALGLNPDGKRSDEVLRDLQHHLINLRAGGRHAVLMADHADLLPADALEEIRLLTNLDDTHGKLLQIVLLGQHALNNSLRQNAMRQVRERITLSFVMPHMAMEEVPALLAHRLRVVGYEGLELFASDAARMLAVQAKGDLRRVVALAHQALAAAASEGAVSVTARHMQAAIRGRLPVLKPRGKLRPVVAGTIGVVAAIGVGAAVMLQQPRGLAPASLASAKAAPARPAPVIPVPVRSAPASLATASQGSAEQASAGVPHAGAADQSTAPVTPAPSRAESAASAIGAAKAANNPSGIAAAPGTPPATNGTAPVAMAAASVAAGALPAPASAAATAAKQGNATTAAKAYAAGLAATAATTATIPTAATAATTATTASKGKPTTTATTTASPQPAPRSASLLQQTLKTGKTWLRDEPGSHFSIKIEDFPASEPARAEAFLDEVRNAIGLSDVRAYPTLNNGQRRIGIAYGSYATEKQARKAMAALQGRWAYAPKIRNVSAIRAAAARAQAAH